MVLYRKIYVYIKKKIRTPYCILQERHLGRLFWDRLSTAHVECGRKFAAKQEVVGCTRKQTWEWKCLSGGAWRSRWVCCSISVPSTSTNQPRKSCRMTMRTCHPSNLTILWTLKKAWYSYIHVRSFSSKNSPLLFFLQGLRGAISKTLSGLRWFCIKSDTRDIPIVKSFQTLHFFFFNMHYPMAFFLTQNQ